MTTLYKTHTSLNADCVSWCENKNVLACAMYQQDSTLETPEKVVGGVEFLTFRSDSFQEPCRQFYKSVAGVFRIFWGPDNCPEPFLYAALTNGCVEIIKVGENETTKVENIIVSPGSSLLCLDLNSQGNLLASSNNKGRILLTDLRSNSELQSWGAHSFFDSPAEVWAVAFDKDDPNIIYSGADDCLLKGWDLRSPENIPIFTNRSHSCGVTKILSHSAHSGLLVTGSYDEKIRIWDTRTIVEPRIKTDTVGGVWDLDWNNNDQLLAACMQGGWHVFHVGPQKLEAMDSGTPENILTYGASWHPFRVSVFACCSFYSRSLEIVELT